MQKFTDWLKNDAVDCGMCDPPMEAQKAIGFLCDYLLGEDWYITMPETTQQVNTAIVFEILLKHSSDFRKEWKKYTKKDERSWFRCKIYQMKLEKICSRLKEWYQKSK